MRRIDVQEFLTQAPDVLAGNEALTVEGKPWACTSRCPNTKAGIKRRVWWTSRPL